MAPALVLFLWSLQAWPQFGWFASLAFAICCALRLARFNARIDVDDQPHKSAGFLTGVPAPVGAGLAFLPMYLWLATDREPLFREPLLVAVWVAAMAFLMISNIATLSWKSIRPGRSVRLWAIALAGMLFAALLVATWWTLAAICICYLALMPLGIANYAKVRRLRGGSAGGEGQPVTVPAAVTPAPE
jgi:CDP-diacylglycerol--serine O-phosphatidyltransferase